MLSTRSGAPASERNRDAEGVLCPTKGEVNTVKYEDAVRVCETYVASLVARDVEAVLALFAENATVEDPVGTESHVGKAALREFYSGAVKGIANAKMTGQPRLAANEVAFPFEVTAGKPGSEIVIAIIDVFRFNPEGKVDSMRAFWGSDNIAKTP